MSKGNSTLIFFRKQLVPHHLEMRLNSYPTCDLGLLIRGITLSIGIPYEINVRTDDTDQHGTHWVADQLISIEPIEPGH